MSLPHSAMSSVILTSDDVTTLPTSIKQKIATQKPNPKADVHAWLLMHTENGSEAKLIQMVAKTVRATMPDKRAKISEKRIAELMEFYLEDVARAPIDIEIEADNAKLRSEYIKKIQAYTAVEIRSFQVGTFPKNPSDPAARWKRERRIFAVPYSNGDLFPAFQFADGSPRVIIKKLLQRLPKEMSAWQVAFWFASGNGWLEGKSPQDCLDMTDDVLDTADRLNTQAIG